MLSGLPVLARPAPAVFAIVADVERYPQFVPGCRAARIESREHGALVATLDVSKGPLTTSFTTRNGLDAPRSVSMQLVSGPFRALDGLWTLVPIGTAGCRIEFDLRFEFARGFPAALFDPVFADLAASLVDAFVSRARETIPAADGDPEPP
jgi:ribosome-associated toxin RatA of RatAB toxin-antitoxin module